MPDSPRPSHRAFEDVAFLAGSANRLAVLETLVSHGPADRPHIVDRIGASRVTVGRILEDLLARGWVAREGESYGVTRVGTVVTEEFGRLLETVDAMGRLETVQPWLPPDFDVDVRRLRDATITVPTWSDSVAPVRRAAELCTGLEALAVAASGVAPDVIRSIRDAAVVDGADVETTMTAEALAVIGEDPTMRAWFDDLLDAGGRVYEHPRHSYLLATCDRVAIIGLNDDLGMPRGLVESTDSAVFDWVADTVVRCREEAERVPPDAFST